MPPIMAEPAAVESAPAAGTRREKVVIVMPAYNAARTIEETFRAIPEGYYDEIVVVDDHSGDDTVERARALNLKAIRHPHNVGYGGNQKTCYMEALRDGAAIVVMLHPDGQYDPAIIPEMIRPIREGRADMVLGSRMLVPGGGEAGRHAAVEARRQPLPDHDREPGHGPRVHRVPHRLPRLQPALPRDRAVPAQLERLRLRHRGHLPGRALRPAGRRGAGREPLLRRRLLGRLPAGRRLRPRHAVDGGALPAAPLGHRPQRQAQGATSDKPPGVSRPAGYVVSSRLFDDLAPREPRPRP